MSQQKTKQADGVDDDTFKYDGGGFGQCISGFGRSTIDVIEEITGENGAMTIEQGERVEWHIKELVRWCRHFNGKSQRLEQQRDALLEACRRRIAHDEKVAAMPGVDDGPLAPEVIEQLAREQAEVTRFTLDAIAKAEGSDK